MKKESHLKSIIYNYEKEEIFEEDLTIPNETKIYNSKFKIYFENAELLSLIFGMLFGGVFCIFEGEILLFLICICIVMVCLIVPFLFFSRLILNEKEIKVKFSSYKWSEVKSVKIKKESNFSSKYYAYIEFNNKKETLCINISDYHIDKKALLKLLVLYRGRYKVQQAHLFKEKKENTI